MKPGSAILFWGLVILCLHSQGMGQTRPEGVGVYDETGRIAPQATDQAPVNSSGADSEVMPESQNDRRSANQETADSPSAFAAANSITLWQEAGPVLEVRPAAENNADSTALKINALTGIGNADPKNYKSLSGKERWHFYLNQNFTTPAAVIAPMFAASWDQASGEPKEWGGGMEGYGRRVASRYGAGLVQGSVQSGMCALLGQEPRYIRSPQNTILGRMGHAFMYGFITYNNEGKRRFALATLGSYYASSMATIMWMPDRFTVSGDGVREGNRQVIFAGVVNQLQEFWPDIRRIVFRRR